MNKTIIEILFKGILAIFLCSGGMKLATAYFNNGAVGFGFGWLLCILYFNGARFIDVLLEDE